MSTSIIPKTLSSGLQSWNSDPSATGKKAEAIKKIQTAFTTNSSELNLNSLQLNTIPGCIGKLKNLQVLYLNINRLEFLPQELGELSNLKTLVLDYNKDLKDLPESLSGIPTLTRITSESTRIPNERVNYILEQCKNAPSLPLPETASNVQPNDPSKVNTYMITALTVGLLVALIGVFTLVKIPGLAQLGPKGGWALVSIGPAVILVGISIKCLEKKQRGHEEKTSTSSSLKEPLKSVPSENLLVYPDWIKSRIAHLPYLKLSGNGVTFADFKDQSPISVFCNEDIVGMHMNLHVTHSDSEKNGETISPTKPFTLPIIIFRQRPLDDYWILVTDRVRIKHRNDDSFEAASILGDGRFNGFLNSPLDTATINQFTNTPNQDHLSEVNRFHLGWIVQRLLQGNDLLVREPKNTLFVSFEDEAKGYWRISLKKL